MKISVRVIIYIAIFSVFVVFIEGKKSQVAKSKAQEVESVLSLMMENGAPVTTFKVEKKDLIIKEKVTLRNCGSSVCFYTSRDKKQSLKLSAKIYNINSDTTIGSVQSISDTPDFRNGLYKVGVRGVRLESEFKVSEVEVKILNNILAVPVQALEDENHVWLINNQNQAARVKIVVGERNSQFVEVKSGLNSGQFIVLDGFNQIPVYKKINIIDSSNDKKVAPKADHSEAKS